MYAKLIIYYNNGVFNPIELLGNATLIDSDVDSFKQGKDFIRQKYIFENSPDLIETFKDKIFLIEQVDFDNMENTSVNAITKKIIGYVDCPSVAQDIVNKLKERSNKYQSWEDKIWGRNEYYPKFNIISVDKLT